MTVGSRYELLVRTELRDRKAGRPEKTRILDEFVAATSYNRKRAITLLNHLPPGAAGSLKRASKPRCYDSTVRESLVVVWKATNYLCSKRLVPFLPDFIAAMQRFGHLPLTEEVKERLLMVSPSTVDRLLSSVRHPTGRGITTTRPGASPHSICNFRLSGDNYNSRLTASNKCDELSQEGWLCPALFKYFTAAPQGIYFKVEEKRS